MTFKKLVMPMVLVLFFLVATYVLYDYKITLEQEIENAFDELYQTGDTLLFFDEKFKTMLNDYFDSLKESGLIESRFSAFKSAESDKVYVLIKSNHEDDNSMGVGYLVFDLDEHKQISNMIISSWVRVASDKDNF